MKKKMKDTIVSGLILLSLGAMLYSCDGKIECNDGAIWESGTSYYHKDAKHWQICSHHGGR